MAAKEEVANEILAIVSDYIAKKLFIKDRAFYKLIAKAFIKKQYDVLEGLLEPCHLEALSRILMPSLKSFEDGTVQSMPDSAIFNDQQSRESNGDSKKYSHKNTVKSISREVEGNLSACPSINSANLFENFTSQVLPETLVPQEKARERPAGIGSAIYKLEHEQTEGVEERVEDKIDEIREALSKHSVVLVQGDTGCGKSTKIPRLLLSDYSKIVCTQPRRLAAISVARKVALDTGCKLGSTVGYAVRFDDKSTKSTRLKFVTDGILLKELSSFRHTKQFVKENSDVSRKEDSAIASIGENPELPSGKKENPTRKPKKAFYDLIIVDEAHERSVNIDFLMGYCKNLNGVKLLILSATLDTEKFIGYFNCPFIEIRHKPHPIDYFYLKTPTDNPLNRSLETALSISEKYDSGDILVFLTGQEDIDRGYKLLMSKVDQEKIEVLRLYSTMPPEEQDRIFVHGKRKIILSTNIAETSITIDTVGFVVDSGKVKRMRRNTGTSVDILETVTIAKDQARQRAGRSGRTGPGKVYRIYTLEEFEKMEESQVPEILRADISDVILSLKALGIDDVVNFDFIDRPLIDSIRHSICFLYYLGALNRKGEITYLGRQIAAMPLRPELSMSLITAKKLGCLDEVSTIAAFLNLSSGIYSTVTDLSETVKKAKKRFEHPKGEFYSFLVIYEEWRKTKFSRSFIAKFGMNGRSLFQALSVKLQLLDRSLGKTFAEMRENAYGLRHTNLSNLENGLIEKSFSSGYFMNVAHRVEGGYSTVFNRIECNIHPSDALYKKNPKLVLFNEIVCIKKEYMRTCLEIEAETLYESCNAAKNT